MAQTTGRFAKGVYTATHPLCNKRDKYAQQAVIEPTKREA
jgi:hypothetical protein